jgi:hypothetical protein
VNDGLIVSSPESQQKTGFRDCRRQRAYTAGARPMSGRAKAVAHFQAGHAAVFSMAARLSEICPICVRTAGADQES